MAVGVVATLKVQEGKEADFEAAARDLAKAVRANEPGNRLYQLFRSKKDKNTYVFMEIYESDEAMKAHGASEHFRTLGAGLAPALAGRPDIQYFDAV